MSAPSFSTITFGGSTHLEEAGQFHRQIEIAGEFKLSLHESLHPVRFSGEHIFEILSIGG